VNIKFVNTNAVVKMHSQSTRQRILRCFVNYVTSVAIRRNAILPAEYRWLATLLRWTRRTSWLHVTRPSAQLLTQTTTTPLATSLINQSAA